MTADQFAVLNFHSVVLRYGIVYVWETLHYEATMSGEFNRKHSWGSTGVQYARLALCTVQRYEWCDRVWWSKERALTRAELRSVTTRLQYTVPPTTAYNYYVPCEPTDTAFVLYVSVIYFKPLSFLYSKKSSVNSTLKSVFGPTAR